MYTATEIQPGYTTLVEDSFEVSRDEFWDGEEESFTVTSVTVQIGLRGYSDPEVVIQDESWERVTIPLRKLDTLIETLQSVRDAYNDLDVEQLPRLEPKPRVPTYIETTWYDDQGVPHVEVSASMEKPDWEPQETTLTFEAGKPYKHVRVWRGTPGTVGSYMSFDAPGDWQPFHQIVTDEDEI